MQFYTPLGHLGTDLISNKTIFHGMKQQINFEVIVLPDIVTLLVLIMRYIQVTSSVTS